MLDSNPVRGAATLIVEAMSAARRRPMATFFGLPLTAALAVGGCLVPLVNFPFILVALAPTVGSLPMIALAVARGDSAPWMAPLLGFRRYERWLGLFWVPYLIAAGAAIPLVAALWIDRRVLYGDGGPVLFGGAGLLSATLLAVVLHRFVLAPFAAADVDRSLPLAEVLERSAKLMDGRKRAVLLRLTGIVLFGLSGTLAAGFGALITAPLALVAAARLYLQLSVDPDPAVG